MTAVPSAAPISTVAERSYAIPAAGHGVRARLLGQAERRSHRPPHLFEVILDQVADLLLGKASTCDVAGPEATVQEPTICSTTWTERRVTIDHRVATLVIRWFVPAGFPQIRIDQMDRRVEGDDGSPLVGEAGDLPPAGR